ncbi:MAG: hypothetical protein QMB59_07490, partial [Bacteroidales bacterium]
VIDQPYVFDVGETRFCVGHGDELGDRSFKRGLMRSFFRSPVTNAVFRFLPTAWSFGLAHHWSDGRKSLREGVGPYEYKGKAEPLFQYLDEFNAKLGAAGEKKVDCFIFGHFHLKADFRLESGGTVYMLGDWFKPQDRGFIYFSGTVISRGGVPKIER